MKYCKHEFDRYNDCCTLCGIHWKNIGRDRKIIGICGKKGSGKDYCAKILICEHGFKQYSFATPLKNGVMSMFDFTYEQCFGSQSIKETVDERWGISPRDALQLIGTDLLRDQLPKLHEGFSKTTSNNIWINNFKYWIKKYPNENIVIPDTRFLNEINAIKELGGQVWHIDASQRIISDGDSHKSENEWCDYNFDVIIDNNKGLEELKLNIKKSLEGEINNE